MLELVKSALRIKTDVFDVELNNIIDAAKADLTISGINPNTSASEEKPDVLDSLLQQAIILYAKANFGYSDNQEKYNSLYISVKKSLALTPKYKLTIQEV